MRQRRSSALIITVALVGAGCHGSRLAGGDVVNLDLPGHDGWDASPEADPGGALDPGGGLDRLTEGAVDASPPGDSGRDTAVLEEPGPADLVAELGPEIGNGDTGPSDPGTPDPGIPDAPLPEDPIFRATEFSVVQPDFCLSSGGGECSVNTAIVNAYLASAIADPADPLNLLLRLVPFDPGNPTTDLYVGGGPCEFVGAAPIACAFSSSNPPAVFQGPLFLPDGCGPPGHPVPCFETAPEKVEMWFMGLFIAMHQARVSGWVETGPGGFRITHGVLHGFVPVNTTKSLQIALPGGVTVSLYDLVKHNPVVDLGGVKTFRFEFQYRADAVAYLD